MQPYPMQAQMLLLNTDRINRRPGEYNSVYLVLTLIHRDLALSHHQR